MSNQCQLSNVTQNYLSEFNCILNRMIDGMEGAGLCDSISQNFIAQMIPHHEAAIQMCRNILKYTTFIPVQNIAENIICEQTRSIQNMRRALNSCSNCRNSERELCQYNQRTHQIMHTMFNDMRCAQSTNEINGNFMREMIPHHRGAVQMCENLLQYCNCICPQLIPIAEAIIASQERGICQMEELLRNTNCFCQK